MDPLTAMLIAGGVSTAAGMYGNYMGQQASNRAMDDAAAQRDAAYQILLRNNPEMLNDLVNTAPEFLAYNPEMYQYIQGESPIMYSDPILAEAALVADSPEMRAMQMDSLGNLQKRSEEGLSARDQADFLRGRRRAGEMARGREQAIINNMQARGMSGSGVEAAMRMMAGQEGAQMLSESQADQAASNAMVREQALRDLLAGSSQVRGQDIALNSTNADILNRFALENSRRQNEINNARVDLKNRSSERETDERRRISGMNTGVRNDAQQINNTNMMNIDRERKTSGNNILLDQYDARTNHNNSLAGAKLGAIPDMYARGAGQANYYQGMANTIGSGISNAGQAYAANEYDERNYQRQKDFFDKYYKR